MLRVETHDVQQFTGTLTTLGFRPDFVDGERFRDELADGETRVERGVRILEHELDVPTELLQPTTRQLQHVLTHEADLTRGRLNQAGERATGGRLAAARLAHEAKGLALLQLERNAVDCLHDRLGTEQGFARDWEVLDEIGNAKEVRH